MSPVKQQINLYLPKFRPPELPASVLRLFQIFMLIIAVMFSTGIILWSTDGVYEMRLMVSETEQEELNTELTAALAALPNRIADPALEKRIERERKELDKRSRVIRFLREDSLNDGDSFTQLVAALSEQKTRGIWLSRFGLLNGGQDVQLWGYVQKPEQISAYLQELGQRKAYQGRTFRQIQVTGQNGIQQKEFFLSTQKAESENIDSNELPGLIAGGRR